uniref:Conotoxin Bu2 n=1 Tax=Conus bullatus TaxID=89438 RepID=O162_CONBU|nr:RecName: Full=Conotoxin Bu2; Flags: Precursor [Conus bullatus]
MKLTCVLIIAVLFLTAITADDSRDKQVYRAVGLIDKMRRIRASEGCRKKGDRCGTHLCCPGLRCGSGRAGGACRPPYN